MRGELTCRSGRRRKRRAEPSRTVGTRWPSHAGKPRWRQTATQAPAAPPQYDSERWRRWRHLSCHLLLWRHLRAFDCARQAGCSRWLSRVAARMHLLLGGRDPECGRDLGWPWTLLDLWVWVAHRPTAIRSCGADRRKPCQKQQQRYNNVDKKTFNKIHVYSLTDLLFHWSSFLWVILKRKRKCI